MKPREYTSQEEFANRVIRYYRVLTEKTKSTRAIPDIKITATTEQVSSYPMQQYKISLIASNGKHVFATCEDEQPREYYDKRYRFIPEVGAGEGIEEINEILTSDGLETEVDGLEIRVTRFIPKTLFQPLMPHE